MTNERKRIPATNQKRFTSEYQPSPESKSRGQHKRAAREAIKREFEKNVQEMLEDPTFAVIGLKNLLKSLPPDKMFVEIVMNMLMRDALKNETPARDKLAILTQLSKVVYGDRLEVSGGVSVNPWTENDHISLCDGSEYEQ